MEQDNLSPGGVGIWVGWQIVTSYMKHNDVSLQQLLQINELDLFKKSKYISYVLSFIFISISFINQSRNNDLISDILISIILIFIIYKTKKNQTKYFSSFWVESVPVYWFIIQSILFGRIV